MGLNKRKKKIGNVCVEKGGGVILEIDGEKGGGWGVGEEGEDYLNKRVKKVGKNKFRFERRAHK